MVDDTDDMYYNFHTNIYYIPSIIILILKCNILHYKK